MGTFDETAIVDYCLLFADQWKQIFVFRFRLQQTKESLPFFRFPFAAKQAQVPVFHYFHFFRLQ